MSDGDPLRPDDPTTGSVIMLSGDLMFASRVKLAAQQAGFEFQMSGSLPEGETKSIRYVILDLSTRSGLTSEIAQQCAAKCPHAELIAYGPHVQVDRLAAAREAGITTVLTNGQFHSQLQELFR